MLDLHVDGNGVFEVRDGKFCCYASGDVPRLPCPASNLNSQLFAPHAIDLDLRAGQFRVWKWGRGGTPLLTLHGFGGSGLDSESLAANLTDDHQVIAQDLVGHGASCCPPLDGFSLQACLDQLSDLLESLKLPRYDLLGYSMGGRLALHWAATCPPGLNKLILVGASAGIEGETDRAARRGWDREMALSARTLGPEAFAALWAQLPLIRTQDAVPEPWRSRLRDRRKNNNTEALARSLEQMGAGSMPHLWDRLGEIAAPTLIVAGEEDPKFCALAERLHQGIPDSQLWVVPGAGHAAHLEKPDVFAEGILLFIRGRAGGRVP
jgi:2-succinyl-6-hydroxy-2,4-cyclohexadiene-1-carboxylate synthase